MKKEYNIVQLNYADGNSKFYILIRKLFLGLIPYYSKYGFQQDGCFEVEYFDTIQEAKDEVTKLENIDSSNILVSKEIHRAQKKKECSYEPKSEMKQNVGVRNITFQMEMVVSIDNISELIPIMEVMKFDKWLRGTAYYNGQGTHTELYESNAFDEPIEVEFTVNFNFFDIGLL